MFRREDVWKARIRNVFIRQTVTTGIGWPLSLYGREGRRPRQPDHQLIGELERAYR